MVVAFCALVLIHMLGIDLPPAVNALHLSMMTFVGHVIVDLSPRNSLSAVYTVDQCRQAMSFPNQQELLQVLITLVASVLIQMQTQHHMRTLGTCNHSMLTLIASVLIEICCQHALPAIWTINELGKVVLHLNR